MTLTEIQTKTKKFADARQALAKEVTELAEKIEALKRKRLAAIKYEVGRVAHYHSELEAAILAAPQVFDSPRTQVFHGIKVGLRKGSGGVEWDDDERTADLIRKHFPEQFDALVKTTYKPRKKALETIDVADLKRIGCTVEATGDVVVIKATDSEVDKVVNALLKGATDEEQKAAA